MLGAGAGRTQSLGSLARRNHALTGNVQQENMKWAVKVHILVTRVRCMLPTLNATNHFDHLLFVDVCRCNINVTVVVYVTVLTLAKIVMTYI